MAGGLLQLVGRGAQDQLVTGNPSFTHFRSVYKRHTDFAMEHFRLYFKTSVLTFPTSGTLTLRTKVERYAQLLNDCYLSIDLPNIYSPVVNYGTSTAYEFQWVRNLGYNMIRRVSILINGQEIVRHTGEWMKLYANLTFDANKRAILDRMIGNVPELYDPANSYKNAGTYPSASSTSSPTVADAEPSILGRTLLVPLHFWFCETVGQSLPMVSLQQSEVEIVVELNNAYQLFTVLNVRPTVGTRLNGTRIPPDQSDAAFAMSHFLSPPLASNSQLNKIPDLKTWNMNPFLECNYIFVGDTELSYIARTDHSFMISQVDMVQADGQYGPSNDLELTMKNLVTRILWVFQRSDRITQNDPDNYTNWEDPYTFPKIVGNGGSGLAVDSNVSQRDILLESTLMLDGQERFSPKQTLFFSGLQLYRFQTGNPMSGVYEYSFALNNDPAQPSGSINGSMFNKTLLRNTLITPPGTSNVIPAGATTTVCILKSTAGSKNPLVITNPNVIDPNTGKPLYGPEDLITIVRKTDATGTPLNTFKYTYTVRAYTQSYNFLRITGGIGNVVFSS